MIERVRDAHDALPFHAKRALWLGLLLGMVYRLGYYRGLKEMGIEAQLERINESGMSVALIFLTVAFFILFLYGLSRGVARYERWRREPEGPTA